MDIGGGSNEDDLTVKLQEIIDVNASVKAALDNGANVKMIMENWDFLQASVEGERKKTKEEDRPIFHTLFCVFFASFSLLLVLG